MAQRAFLAFGANMGDRAATISQALSVLDRPGLRLVGHARFYETRPVGFCSERLFLNTVAEFSTTLPPDALLQLTQQVERELGRTNKSIQGAYSDRPIDIDLLLVGDMTMETPELTLPHPQMHRRRFVLEPLAEIAPDAVHPVLQLSAAEMLRKLNLLRIAEVREADDVLLDGINALLPQLSASAPKLDMRSLQALLSTPSTHLYTGRDEVGGMVAMLTLCIALSPTGIKAWVEDVVTDAEARGRGYARQLMHHAIAEARRLGAGSINLTSRPERESANRLYRSLGFELRNTNVYRLKL